LFFDRLIKNKPTAVKTTPEYKAMIKERRSENGRKAMEARKAKQESRQGQGSEEDAKRPAKPFGWRLKGKHNYRKPTRADISSGKAYYEARINRADSKRTKFPMLERGGFMAKGGNIYSSDDAYESIILKDGVEVDRVLVRGRNKGEAREMYEDLYESKMLKKHGENISYEIILAPNKMAKGGAIENQYEGREAEDIWNNLTRVQRNHFLVDHEDDLKLKEDGMSTKDYFETRDALARLKFSELKKNIQDEFAVHTFMGQYADGGFMEHGGDVDKGGMIYALREFVSSGEIANKTDVLNYDDIAKIRRIAIQYYMDNGDEPYSYGELAKVLSYANDKFKSGMMAKGGVFYSDSHKLGHE
jgi:hypothetical protein